MIVAHRGASAYLPEHTLEAKALAPEAVQAKIEARIQSLGEVEGTLN